MAEMGDVDSWGRSTVRHLFLVQGPGLSRRARRARPGRSGFSRVLRRPGPPVRLRRLAAALTPSGFLRRIGGPSVLGETRPLSAVLVRPGPFGTGVFRAEPDGDVRALRPRHVRRFLKGLGRRSVLAIHSYPDRKLIGNCYFRHATEKVQGLAGEISSRGRRGNFRGDPHERHRDFKREFSWNDDFHSSTAACAALRQAYYKSCR